MSENILFLGNKILEIPPFFQTRPGDLGEKVHACSLRFSALKLSVTFLLSLVVHHQSLAFRTRLYHAENEAPEEDAGLAVFQTFDS